MNPIKLVAVFILSLVLMACGSGTAPPASALTMSFTPTKAFRFTWPAATGATYYNLKEAATDGSGYTLIKRTTGTTFDHVVPLYARLNAKYILDSCSETACSTSAAVFTSTQISAMTSSIGYAKASNTEADDEFGISVSLSSDGNTLAVGAHYEDSNSTTINNVGSDGGVNNNTGAVYVFTRSGTTWTQQAYVKASNTDASDLFGISVSLSSDGNTLAVGAHGENSDAKGIGKDQTNNTLSNSGAVYVFTRSGTTWTQQAYVKASNTQEYDRFGFNLSLSSDGNTLAVGAHFEASDAKGIGKDQTNNSAPFSGAVYVFTRSGTNWTQQAYVKASNTGASDLFGGNVSLSSDGNTLAVGAVGEDSDAKGIGEDQTNNSASASGAVYVFTRSGTNWTQQAYVKASNTEEGDFFGYSLSLSSDGNTLAVSAFGENSNAKGIGEDQTNNSALTSGAVYVFTRSGTNWTQQAYVKASNTEADDEFGKSVSLSSDGNTLAVGAYGENSNAIGIGGTDSNNSAVDSGAVYLY